MFKYFQGYHFYNLPQKLTRADYEQFCHFLVERLKDNPNIKSIYLEGEEWKPGFSDIDILLVYPEQFHQPIEIPSPWSISAQAHLFCFHKYGTYSQEDFRNLFYLIPQSNLKLLFGQKQKINQPDEQLNLTNHKFLQAFLVFDVLVNKLLLFPDYLRPQRIDLRNLIGEIHSLSYTLKMINFVSSNQIDFTYFTNQINQLRENWFEKSFEENLKQIRILLAESIDLILEIVLRLTDFIQPSFRASIDQPEISFRNYRYSILFQKKWSKELFLGEFKKGEIILTHPLTQKTIKSFKLVLPLPLSFFLLTYTQANGLFSQWIKKSLKVPLKTFTLEPGLEKHIRVVNRFVERSAKYPGLFKIPFPYGLITTKQTFQGRLGRRLLLCLRLIKD